MKAYPPGAHFFRDYGPEISGGENLTFSPPEDPLPAGPIPPSRTTTITYTYDSLYRLTAADYDTGSYFHYTYDATGNRLTQETELLTNSYVYDSANRLTSVDGQAYTYDSNGNLLSDGVSAYTYDKANRLSTVSQGGVSYSYAYNGMGDRLQQTVDTVTTNYTLDLAGGLTQVLSDGTSTYLYGLGRIGEYDTTWTYHLADALGSVRQIADSNGGVTLTQNYAPYGDVLDSYGETTSNYGFAGEWTDGTGLQYLRARYLNTGIGRFISRDSWVGNIREPITIHKFNYANNNPINFSDPSGFCSQPGWDNDSGIFTKENCDRLEEGDLDFTEEWYYAFADYVDKDLPQTAANMRHYLDGSSTELRLSTDFMRNDIYGWSKVNNDVKDLVVWYVRKFIDDLEICEPFEVGPDIYASGFTPPYIQAWEHWPFDKSQLDIAGSLGSFRLDVEISGSLHRTSNKRNANSDLILHLVVLDRYNWHAGLSVSYEGNQILDEWAGSLEDAGLAKSFLVRGDLYEHFDETVSGLWFGIDVSDSPPGKWVEASCIGSQFDIDQEGPGNVDYCGNPMR